MDLTKPSELKRLLATHGQRLSRRFGQNFLVSRSHLERIVEAAAVQPDEVVFEVGPGVGTLTLELAARACHVVTIELDRHLLPILEEVLAPCPNITLVSGDALRLDWNELLTPFTGGERGSGFVKVVANIPYNITSPLIVRFLESKKLFSDINLLVQKEVAQRLTALPGTPEYGALTVFVQFYAAATIVLDVPRGAFFPPPKVDSAVLRLVRHAAPPVQVPGETALFAVSRAAFGQRRKTLANALSNAASLPFSRDEITNALKQAEIDPNRRGETLTLAEFARIARSLPWLTGEFGGGE